MNTSDPRTLALVIDDASEILASAFQILEGRGYRVATRRTVVDGFRYAQSAKPGLVLIGDPFWELEVAATIHRLSPRSHVRRLTHSPLPRAAAQSS